MESRRDIIHCSVLFRENCFRGDVTSNNPFCEGLWVSWMIFQGYLNVNGEMLHLQGYLNVNREMLHNAPLDATFLDIGRKFTKMHVRLDQAVALFMVSSEFDNSYEKKSYAWFSSWSSFIWCNSKFKNYVTHSIFVRFDRKKASHMLPINI